MSNLSNALIIIVANTLRDNAPSSAPAALSAVFLTASISDLKGFTTWVRDEAIPTGKIGATSRPSIMEAVSTAIITCGAHADECKEGSQRNLQHLGRMEAVDDLGTAVLGF